MATGNSWPSTQTRLIRDIRELNNHVAWQEFVDLYGPFIFRFCRKWSLQEPDAQDVMQEVFKQVAQAIPNFHYDRERGRFRGWLKTISIHEIYRYVNKTKRSVQAKGGEKSYEIIDSLESDLQSDWDEEFYGYVFNTVFARAREEFSREKWEAFESVWMHEADSKDVAADMGRTIGWVYKVKFNVLRRIEELVKAFLQDESLFD